MVPRLDGAEYMGGHRIRLQYADGRVGEVDLSGELWGEVFEPLRDVVVFQRFRIDPQLNTLVWETGADLAPEFLYASTTQPGLAADAPRSRSNDGA